MSRVMPFTIFGLKVFFKLAVKWGHSSGAWKHEQLRGSWQRSAGPGFTGGCEGSRGQGRALEGIHYCVKQENCHAHSTREGQEQSCLCQCWLKKRNLENCPEDCLGQLAPKLLKSPLVAPDGRAYTLSRSTKRHRLEEHTLISEVSQICMNF